jgi:Cu/Ag efflux protein CusF
MTMLFQGAAMLGLVKAVDKVKFRAEEVGGAFVVTEIQIAK